MVSSCATASATRHFWGTKQLGKFSEKAIIFAATQRSGSTMMVDDFQNLTGRSRTESEGFFRLVLAPGIEPMTWEEALDRVKHHRRNEAVFFDKVMFHQVHRLAAMIEKEKNTAMGHPFAEVFADATWVYIRRANIFEQAVSKYIAEELQVWDAADAKSSDFNAKFEFNIDIARIHLKALLQEDNNWRHFFRTHGIKPIQVYYEDAVANFPGYLAPVFEAVGIEFDPSKAGERRMQKVGNERNNTLADILEKMMLRDLMSGLFDAQAKQVKAAE